MQTPSDTAVVPARRRVGLRPIAAALVVAIALGGFALVSAATTHRAGAATVRPHAIDAYMEFRMSATGVTGEDASTTPGDIEVDSFQWGVSRAVGSSSGAGSGKVTFNDFTIARRIDRASPTFFKNCAAGTHYKTVVLYVRKAGGQQGDFMTITFTDVVARSVSWSASGVSGEVPTETVAMVPKSYVIKYTVVAPTG